MPIRMSFCVHSDDMLSYENLKANHNVSPILERKKNTDYTSLVALVCFQTPLVHSIALMLYLQASGAAARDIEKSTIEDMHDSIHSKSVMSLRAPIGRGVLADFLSCMVCHSFHDLCINLLTNTSAPSRCDSSRDQHAPGNPM